MFTGIIEEVGTVLSLRRGARSGVLRLRGRKIFSDLKLGDSVAVNGVCLTATERGGDWFAADVMHETLDRSSLGDLRVGSPVNLERAMAADGRFGGHIVSGHIDGTGVITGIRSDDNAVWYTVQTPSRLMRYIIEKGSIAIDGISLTVARAERDRFQVSIIPHTARETILSTRRVGDTVNLENDVVGKYLEHFLAVSNGKETRDRPITREFLTRAGF
ncbi:MAG: riboflavin synthase [Intestinimonas sp.]|jgi:riboflavin synthase|nr:riboflavin synthase [Intestinimonas sp.]